MPPQHAVLTANSGTSGDRLVAWAERTGRRCACDGFATLDPEATHQDPASMRKTGKSSLPAFIHSRLANPAP
jgi:hypothetical protein